MNLSKSENASNSGSFADDIPTVQQQVVVSKLEYEKLKRLVREGEAERIKSRNRMIAVFAVVLVFAVASAYMILGG